MRLYWGLLGSITLVTGLLTLINLKELKEKREYPIEAYVDFEREVVRLKLEDFEKLKEGCNVVYRYTGQ